MRGTNRVLSQSRLLNNKQQGLGMIEAMITLLVTSIGLLGIAALQATALRANNSAYWNSQAVFMAIDMADRIRANPTQFANYTGVDTSKSYDQECIENKCTPQQLISADASEWKAALENLPGGRGIIRSPQLNSLELRVMWDDEGTGATGTGCSNDTSVDMTCYIIEVNQ